MRKRWIILGIGLVAVVGAAYFFHSKSGGGAGTPQSAEIGVRVEEVGRGRLVETVSATGVVEPKINVQISAKVAARIVELPFAEGQAVKKGDVLVKLDARELESQLRATEARYAAQKTQIDVSMQRLLSAEAKLKANDAEIADAEREYKRQKELLGSRDVSQQAVDQAETKLTQLRNMLDASRLDLVADRQNLSVLKHTLDAADAEIAQAKDALSYTTITAPIDGILTKLNAKVGELVMTGTMNNAGTVILEVADLSVMLVKARIDETSIAKLEVGQKAKIHIQAYADQEFTGEVVTVALALTEEVGEQTKYYKTEVLLNTAGKRMFSGLQADVQIDTKIHENVLRVQSQAVLGRTVDDLPPESRDSPNVDKTKSITPVVYRVIDGKTVVTPVKIAASDLNDTMIEAGLNENERVVIGPYKVLDGLANDQKVKVEGVTTRPTTEATTGPTTPPTTRPN